MLALSIKQALHKAKQVLYGHESAQIDSELLLAHAIGRDRTYLYTWPEKQLSPSSQALFEELLERRALGEPVAYLIGTRDFWSFTLRVNPHVLIPRPETELLVETALSKLGEGGQRVADLGTGSGAIALAIAHERPDCQVLATDFSAEALQLASANALQLGLKNVEFKQGSWYAALLDTPFNMIVSNPPYIAPDDPHLVQGDLRFEPATALSASDSGLADLYEIVSGAPERLADNGWLLLEHGFDQGAALRTVLLKYGFSQVQTLQDINGCDRLSLGCWAIRSQ